MKLYDASQINRIDQNTISHGTSSAELMDRAANRFVEFMLKRINRHQRIACFCGKGNNGGDGILISEKLLLLGFQVQIIILDFLTNPSPGFEFYLKRLETSMPLSITRLKEPDEPIDIQADIIVDALFGNGLNRPLSEKFRALIDKLNKSKARIFSVDIASGLFARFEHGNPAVQPSYSYSFQFPKIEFLNPDLHGYVGEWNYGNIGLITDPKIREESEIFFDLAGDIAKLIHPRKAFDHKGSYGTAVIIGGKRGMAGAPMLSASSALRTGTGLCKIVSTKEVCSNIQGNIHEAMTQDLQSFYEEYEDGFPAKVKLAIGPGMGTDIDSLEALKFVLQRSEIPLVIDADALNLLALHQELFDLLPEGSILTPHIGEFNRLFNPGNTHVARIEKQQSVSMKRKIYILLKGRYSSLSCPGGELYYNSSGNPGMATGGSGDVLTGMIVSLLAQAYPPSEASRIATFVHGLAGDLAAEDKSCFGMLAGDIVENIPGAFKMLLNKNR